MITDYIFILPAIALSFSLVFGGFVASKLLAPSKYAKAKTESYECGEQTIGSSWVQFNVGYYLFGLIFLVFDVEAAFLFPWALVLREVGIVGLIEAVVFILILVVGFVYAWKKGALKWV